MKYSKQIIVLMTINIMIAFLMIFIGHNTRKIELSNNTLINDINKKKEEINVNQIEYSYHNNLQYLKKIYSLYFNKIENKQITKIYSLQELLNEDQKNVFLIDY